MLSNSTLVVKQNSVLASTAVFGEPSDKWHEVRTFVAALLAEGYSPLLKPGDGIVQYDTI